MKSSWLDDLQLFLHNRFLTAVCARNGYTVYRAEEMYRVGFPLPGHDEPGVGSKRERRQKQRQIEGAEPNRIGVIHSAIFCVNNDAKTVQNQVQS